MRHAAALQANRAALAARSMRRPKRFTQANKNMRAGAFIAAFAMHTLWGIASIEVAEEEEDARQGHATCSRLLLQLHALQRTTTIATHQQQQQQRSHKQQHV